jgi:ribosome biogenesis protein Tsr3
MAFRKGPTFETPDHDPLQEYSKATSELEIEEIERSFPLSSKLVNAQLAPEW